MIDFELHAVRPGDRKSEETQDKMTEGDIRKERRRRNVNKKHNLKIILKYKNIIVPNTSTILVDRDVRYR